MAAATVRRAGRESRSVALGHSSRGSISLRAIIARLVPRARLGFHSEPFVARARFHSEPFIARLDPPECRRTDGRRNRPPSAQRISLGCAESVITRFDFTPSHLSRAATVTPIHLSRGHTILTRVSRADDLRRGPMSGQLSDCSQLTDGPPARLVGARMVRGSAHTMKAVMRTAQLRTAIVRSLPVLGLVVRQADVRGHPRHSFARLIPGTTAALRSVDAPLNSNRVRKSLP
jgi:hypothetical protein